MRRLFILSVILCCVTLGSPFLSLAQTGPQPITPENVDQLTPLANFGRGQVRGVGWTPDKTKFVLAGVQGLWFYNVQDLDADPKRSIPFPGWVWNFAFSPDGQLIAMLNLEGSLYTGEFHSDTQEITNVTLLEESVKAFDFTADGKWLVTTTGAQLTGWLINKQQANNPILQNINIGSDILSQFGFHTFALSPDSSTVAVIIGTTVRLLDLDTGTMQVLIDTQTNSDLQSYLTPENLAFSPNGDLLAITWAVGELTLVSTEDGTIRKVIETKGNLQQIAFSPDGHLVATGWASAVAGAGYAVKLWDSSTGELVATLDHPNELQAVAFSPDGTQLATIENFTPHLWDIKAQAQIPLPDVHSGPFWAVAVHPDGKQIAVSSRDGVIRTFDVSDFKILQRLDSRAGPVVDVAYSPDGSLLAGTGNDGNVRLWNVITGKQVAVLEGDGPFKPVVSLAFNPGGEQLAVGGANTTLRRWKVSTAQELDTLWQTTTSELVFNIVFNSDGTLLAAGNSDIRNPAADHEVKVWNVATGKQITSLTHPGVVSGLAFHPSQLLLATSHTTTLPANEIGYQENMLKSAETTIWLWDAISNTEQVFTQLNGPVSNLTFSPDGKLLLGIESTHLYIWDFESTQELAMREITPPIVFTDIAFLTDGTLLVTTADDGTIQLWGIP